MKYRGLFKKYQNCRIMFYFVIEREVGTVFAVYNICANQVQPIADNDPGLLIRSLVVISEWIYITSSVYGSFSPPELRHGREVLLLRRKNLGNLTAVLTAEDI